MNSGVRHNSLSGRASIRFDSVHLKFGDRIVLENLSFSVAKGEKVVIRGESGSGKTSLLKGIAGAVNFFRGTVEVNGVLLSPATVQEIRKSIAYIGQEPVLGANRVRDALLLPFTFKSHRHHLPDDKQIHGLLKSLRLKPSILGQTADDLSGGEKQRIAVARAVLLKKTIYLADEITSALDPVNKDAVMDLLLDREHTVVSISHDPDWIARCDRVVVLEGGRLKEVHPIGNH
ncbi:MAG: ABC transporter ATP-binding protein [Desulfobacterales bacterium]